MLTYGFLSHYGSCSPEDADDIRDLIKQLALDVPGQEKPALSTNQITLQLHEQNLHVLVVRSDEGAPGFRTAIIGMGTLSVIPTLTGNKANLEDIVVDGAYRGRDIGEEIVKRLIAKAKELHLTRIELTSHPRRIAANRLYQKLGFVQRETNNYRLDL